MQQAQLGLIGLATMGQNFVRNFLRNGVSVAVFNRSIKVTEDFASKYQQEGKLFATQSLLELVGKLQTPRVIILLVKAGAPVDEMIANLIPLLEKGDIVIDSGNSFYKDSMRRELMLKEAGLNFISMGISGGEEGALNGPSLMPSGNEVIVKKLLPTFELVTAKVPHPCVSYVGNSGSGHFVKMVHNGIEYAEMQLLAESYHILKNLYKKSNLEISRVFEEWNKRELASYLLEISYKILRKKDEMTGLDLIDLIKDQAEGKGTGLWTTTESLALATPTPSIAFALMTRQLSCQTTRRSELKNLYLVSRDENETLIDTEILYKALLAAKTMAYAQGVDLIQKIDQEQKFGISLYSLLKTWQGGCIIRSELLRPMIEYYKEKNSGSLLTAPFVQKIMNEGLPALRRIVSTGVASALPMPLFSTSITYIDLLTTEHLPTNLVQAQRDFFGAHTYLRTDREGIFHTSNWEG